MKKKAGQEVARKLREIADQIESGTYPRLFGVEFPKPDAEDAKFKSFIFSYNHGYLTGIGIPCVFRDRSLKVRLFQYPPKLLVI